MTEAQEKMQQIASTFGDSDIKIFVGRDKVFPDKPVSEAKVQQLEDALKSPEKEMSSIRVTESNKTIYRSHEGAVTTDTKNVAEQFQAPKASYFDLLQAQTEKVPGYFDNKFTPEFVNQKLNTPDPIVPSNPEAFGKSIDRWVMTEAVDRGMSKDEALKLVAEQSPYVAQLSKDQARFPKAFQSYVAPEGGALSREYDAALATHTKTAEAKESIPEPQLETKSPELATPQLSTLPELDLSALSNGKFSQPLQTKDEQIRAVIEPKLVEQMSKAPTSTKPGGAIVHVNQSKAVIPIEPTQQQLNEQMPAIVTPPTVSEQPSLEQALAAANARIDSMQKQLDLTTASVQNLSAQVQDRSLKGWAQNTVQKMSNTAQTFAVQAKTNVVAWVNKGIDQIQQKAQHFKDVAQKAVGDVKFAAQKGVSDVKLAAHVKTIQVKESVRGKVNDILSPVDSAALTKAADQMINKWGNAGRFEGNTFDFQRSGAGEISIHTKDGTPVFAKGTLTNQADAKTIAHLSQIPRRVELAKNLTPTPQTTVKQQALAR